MLRKLTEKCLDLFGQCLRLEGLSGDQAGWLEDCLARLRWWSFGLKAQSLGRSSLDRRLSHRVDVRDAIADILTGLAEALGEYIVKSRSFGLENEDGSDEGRSDISSPVSVHSAFSYASSDEGAEVNEDSGVSATHYAFFIDMSLKSLLRFSILIRKAGDKLRYKRADDDLGRIQMHAPETYTEFRAHLETLILIGPSEHSLLTRLDSAPVRNDIPQSVNIVLRAWINSRLSPIQNRLVQANIIRRHRIMCSRKDGRHSRSTQPKPAPRPAAAPTGRPSSSSTLPPEAALRTTEPNRPEFTPLVVPIPRIIEEASSAQTTTVIGSELSTAAMRSGRASSAVSKLTRTGRNQDYPKASILDRSPQCPYCGIVLDLGYAKNEKKWQ
jgi:hypothetical protein